MATEKSEHPILFSAPMVRAILDGRKTQTRRIVPLPEVDFFDGYNPHGDVRWSTRTEPTGTHIIRNRYGKPGDRLWVKETFCVGDGMNQAGDPKAPTYRADWPDVEHGRWRPSIFMRRDQSRIDLEVTGVRVERLQSMPADDVEREGVALDHHLVPGVHYTIDQEWWPAGERKAREVFAEVWDAINGDRAPWKSNPWVWVIEFKRVRP